MRRIGQVRSSYYVNLAGPNRGFTKTGYFARVLVFHANPDGDCVHDASQKEQQRNMSVTHSSSPQNVQPTFAAGPILVAVSIVVCLTVIFWDGLLWMFEKWEQEEYNHGYLIPVVAFYLLWLRAEKIGELRLSGSWLGVLFVAASLAAFLLGELSSIYQIIQYGFSDCALRHRHSLPRLEWAQDCVGSARIFVFHDSLAPIHLPGAIR